LSANLPSSDVCKKKSNTGVFVSLRSECMDGVLDASAERELSTQKRQLTYRNRSSCCGLRAIADPSASDAHGFCMGLSSCRAARSN
jgi:hypothetical protein